MNILLFILLSTGHDYSRASCIVILFHIYFLNFNDRIYANGASGGKGHDNFIQSKGDQIRALVKLTKGEQLFISVGQMGSSGCKGCKENNVSV